MSVFHGDSLRKLISPVWVMVEENRLVRWTQRTPEIHFLFLNFFLRSFLSKLCLLEVTTFIPQIEEKLKIEFSVLVSF